MGGLAFNQLAGYMRFQLLHAEAPLLNIGVGGNPAGIEGEGVFQFDIDVWDYPRFVQGDAHHLPYRDDAFTSVVCGDVLEHLTDPLQALREMRRVAHKVVLTVFEEWRLPGEGQYVEAGHTLFSSQGNRGDGVVTVFPEARISHGPHINQFTLPMLHGFFDAARLRIRIQEEDCPGIHEGHRMKNWLFVLDRA